MNVIFIILYILLSFCYRLRFYYYSTQQVPCSNNSINNGVRAIYCYLNIVRVIKHCENVLVAFYHDESGSVLFKHGEKESFCI